MLGVRHHRGGSECLLEGGYLLLQGSRDTRRSLRLKTRLTRTGAPQFPRPLIGELEGYVAAVEHAITLSHPDPALNTFRLG